MNDAPNAAAGAPATAATSEGPDTGKIALAALLGAAERVLGDVIGVPADDLPHIVRGLSLLAKHLFGHRHPK